jgi:signal transduction histidine kinase
MILATPTLRRAFWSVFIPALALAYAALAVAVPWPSQGEVLSYAAASLPAHTADVIAGLALIGSGIAVCLTSQRRTIGVASILAGVTWFALDWEGWGRGPEFVRSLGTAAAPLTLALLFQLVVTLPRGRASQPGVRAAVVLVYVVAITFSVGQALFRAPALDPHCWRDCLGNTFLTHGDRGVAQTLAAVWVRASVAIGIAIAAIAAKRLWQLGIGRRALGPALAAGVVVGASEAAYSAALIAHPTEDPRTTLFSSIFLIRCIALTGFAFALAWAAMYTFRGHARIARLAADLGEASLPGGLQVALATATGDPTMDVAYWTRASHRYLDVHGRPREPPQATLNRTVTSIVRDGEPLALVGHDAILLDEHEFEEQIGSAMRLAVDSERLQAEILAQVADLRSSRARVVEAGDAERQRLERNLHDGAQQRLLAVSYELRLALAGARADGQRDLASHLASATDEVNTMIAELREVARGIYPAALAEAGIAAALPRLADSAPIAVELDSMTTDRFPLAVETAAYATFVEAVNDAAARGATFISFTVEVAHPQLVITTADDAPARASQLTQIADRVGAVGGRLEPSDAGLRVEIPCA